MTERYADAADGRRIKREHAGGITVYAAGGLWEETVGAGGRRQQQVLYLHGDHLGSVSVVTDQAGQVVSRQQYDPWGAPRGGEGIGEGQTTLDFTGQRRDGTGLLFYNARYYDPAVGRFLSPDTIVPGMADGTGGGAATLGYDENVAHTLTVGFHEPAFAAALGAEHRFTLVEGFWFQLDQQARREAKYQGGPLNPQALNRYAYVLNNPLRYTDPTGHEEYDPDAGGDEGSPSASLGNPNLGGLGDPAYPRNGSRGLKQVAIANPDRAKPHELAFLRGLSDYGYEQLFLDADAAGPDFQIEGRWWELKTLVTSTSQNAVEQALRAANGQEGVDRVIIDGSGRYGGKSLDYKVALAALDARARRGSLRNLLEVRILTGDDRVIVWTRPVGR